ncbi:hypothetical protein EVAR_37057_1 [Eumeta japonica]|uniref:Uncharacterized protein n=1 Tax=Eumeta variegata TaxID=151549 RepID=A0A4C1WHH5_EUMVA|nr:hypothetical protein EVAR_37057_1 [Eumeta japonica]
MINDDLPRLLSPFDGDNGSELKVGSNKRSVFDRATLRASPRSPLTGLNPLAFVKRIGRAQRRRAEAAPAPAPAAPSDRAHANTIYDPC